MSKERARGQLSSSEETERAQSTQTPTRPTPPQQVEAVPIASDTTSSGIPSPGSPTTDEQKPSARAALPAGGGGDDTDRPRQVIAVSASRGPAAFFNLARKFLVTDEMCDLSALEGAIVSAVDAAHLLERSKLATIVRVQTSYVNVEPKRRKQTQAGQDEPRPRGDPGRMGEGSPEPFAQGSSRQRASGTGAGGGRELRRARIVITVKRTQDYERWLEENPLQAIIAGDGDDDETAAVAESETV